MLQSSVLKTADIQVWLAFVFRQSNYLSTTDHLVLYTTLATQTFEIVYLMCMQYNCTYTICLYNRIFASTNLVLDRLQLQSQYTLQYITTLVNS